MNNRVLPSHSRGVKAIGMRSKATVVKPQACALRRQWYIYSRLSAHACGFNLYVHLDFFLTDKALISQWEIDFNYQGRGETSNTEL